MRLSEQTVSLLKNFASINQNLLFKTGNKLQTISAQKNILVHAEVPESFPSDFAIYDLNKMLGVPTMIVVPPEKELVFPEPEVKFTMTNGDFSQATKAAALLGLPHICVVGNNSQITLNATDVNNSSSDNFATEVGSTDKTFCMVFKIEMIFCGLPNIDPPRSTNAFFQVIYKNHFQISLIKVNFLI